MKTNNYTVIGTSQKRLFLFASALIVCLFMSFNSIAQCPISQPSTNNTFGSWFGSGQSFTPSCTGLLTQAGKSGGPNPTLIEIRSGNGGSGAVLYSQASPVMIAGIHTLVTPVNVTGGSPYTVLFYNSSGNNGDSFSTEIYPGGGLFAFSGTWFDYTGSYDLTFSVNIITPCGGVANCGTGAEGAYLATVNTTLAGGVHNYTSFTINAGVTVTVTGSAPLDIRCTGAVNIQGTLAANGGNGGNGVTFSTFGVGGIGVAGGANGGNGAYSDPLGPLPGDAGSGTGGGGAGDGWSGGGGAGYAAAGASSGGVGGFGGIAYGNPQISPVVAGSGGGGGSGGFSCGSGGGGAGGGTISISACGSFTIGAAGAIRSNGGNGGTDGTGNCGGGGGGSGGSILLSASTINNLGAVSALAGVGGSSAVPGSPYFGTGATGAAGRIRMDYASYSGGGTVTPVAQVNSLGTAPVITCPSNVSVNNEAGLCSALVNYPAATATGTPTPTITYSQNSGTSFPVGTTTVTATATNPCGSTSCTFTVTVTDNQPPTAICQNITVQLSPAGTATITPAQVNNGSTDNCGTVNLVSVSPNTFNCANVGTASANDLIISEYVEGSSNNKYMEIFNGTASTKNLADYELRLYANGSSTVTTANNLGAAGSLAPGATVVLKNSAATVYGGTSFIFPAVNWNGDDAIALFNTVTTLNADIFGRIGDDPGTAWTLGGNTTLDKTLRRNATVVNGVTVNPSGTGPSAFTTLSTEWTQFNQDDVSGLGAHTYSPPPNVNTVTLTINDGHGNTSTCTAIVTVQDVTPPTAICQNVTLPLDATGNATLPAAMVNNGSSDVCGIATMSVVPGTFTCANVGSNTVTLTVTDVNGLSSTCTATVTVQDVTPPTANCQNITVQLNAGGTASITAAQVNNGSTDACGLSPTMTVTPSTFNCSDVTGDPVTDLFISEYIEGNSNNKAIEIYNGTGAAVNLATGVYAIKIYSNGSLTASSTTNLTGTVAAGDVYVIANNLANAAILAQADQTSGNISFNGNDAVALVKGVSPVNVDIFGTIGQDPGIEWGSGLVSTADNTLVRKAAVTSGVTINPPPGFPTLATEWDGFPTDNSTNLGSHTININGGNLVTLTVTDLHGNSSTCTSYVTVQDVTAPTINFCPSNTTVACGASTLPAATGTATATDNCSATVTFSDAGTVNPTCGGTITRTWTATDPSLNSTSSCVQIITVSPGALPIIANPGNITVACGAVPAASTLSFSNGLSGGCLISGTSNTSTQTAQSPAGACGGTITETWTASDACGRALTSVSRTITVSPAALPTMTAPGNITVACGAVPGATTLSFSNGLSGGCLISGTSNASTKTAQSPAGACGGTITETWTATDACGRALASVSRTITVSPAALPTMTAPGNITVPFSSLPAPSTLPYSNGLSGGCLISGNSNLSTYSPAPTACVGSVTQTWTATDPSGRPLASVSRTVTVLDDVPPTAVCQNVTVNLSAGGTASVTAAQVNNGSFDNCGTLNLVSVVPSAFTCANTGANTVILTVNDGHGNTSTCSATVTVVDNILPTITCPPTVTVNSNPGVCYATGVALGTPVFGDNCAGATVANNVTPSYQYPVGGTFVQWEVTDLSSNKASCNQLVIVQDNELPHAICKNICVYLNSAGVATITAADINNVSYDNCGIGSLVASKTTFSYADAGANTVTLTVTDINGNTSTCTSIVTVGEYYSLFGAGPACSTPTGQPDNCHVNIGNGNTINGNVGSYRLITTGGGVVINGNVYSGGRVNYANGVSSKSVSAANLLGVSGLIFQTGNSADITGDVNVTGNININQNGGSFVTGTVRHPSGTTYAGPVPGGGVLTAAPVLPVLPGMPTINAYSCGGANITTTATLNPGSYGNITLGNPAGVIITFHGPGNYYFSSIKMGQGGIHTFKYDFMGLPGKINIYVCGDIDFGQYEALWANPNTPDACRVYFETHGTGSTNGTNSVMAAVIELGSHFYGRVWAPYGGIHVGSGSCCTYATGSLWSAKQVQLEGAVTFNGCSSPCPPGPKIGEETTATDGSMSDMLQVYPNPTSGKTTVRFFSEFSTSYTLKVMDNLGRVVLSNESKAIAGDNTREVDMSHLAKGLYLIEVGNQDHSQKVKVVVQ